MLKDMEQPFHLPCYRFTFNIEIWIYARPWTELQCLGTRLQQSDTLVIYVLLPCLFKRIVPIESVGQPRVVNGCFRSSVVHAWRVWPSWV